MLSTDGDAHGTISISSNSFKCTTQIIPQIHLMPVVFSLMKALLPLCLIIVCVLVQKLASLPAIEITPHTEAKYLSLLLEENEDQTHSYSQSFFATENI